jgi:hypothetical protein
MNINGKKFRIYKKLQLSPRHYLGTAMDELRKTKKHHSEYSVQNILNEYRVCDM